MAQVNNDYDLTSSASKHVLHHITGKGKDYEMTNFATGTALSVALDSAEKTNTYGFHGESNLFESENKGGKVTFTLIQGKKQDKVFQAEHNDKLDIDGDNFTYYDSDTGERINMYGCTIESEPTGVMANGVQTMQWVWLVSSWTRTFDGIESTDDAINE